MVDLEDPLNKFLRQARHITETTGFSYAVKEETKSIYFWGKHGFFHVKWIETFERDYWEVCSADSSTYSFDDEFKAVRWIHELIEIRIEEEIEHV